MPKFEVRCNTERILIVEADDENAARVIAEDTDFSEWESADSLYEIEALDGPNGCTGPETESMDSDYAIKLEKPI